MFSVLADPPFLYQDLYKFLRFWYLSNEISLILLLFVSWLCCFIWFFPRRFWATDFVVSCFCYWWFPIDFEIREVSISGVSAAWKVADVEVGNTVLILQFSKLDFNFRLAGN
ncbi:hypothetical protein MKW98_014755 [Papaver atlanticum]|uniref:Transmembrane protein n=1 Tax=Papaver atlanticum TaxID=357466 RepID=A0AAD4SF87_9MAGN|nr:hypothetical protein MKW98_014755 [Papaver atlanticum]